MSQSNNEGVRITPEMIALFKSTKSAKELLLICRGFGIGLDETEAQKWFEQLNSSGLVSNKLSSSSDSLCPEQHCPKCGSTDYTQRYIPDSPTSGCVYCQCNHCGYNDTKC